MSVWLKPGDCAPPHRADPQKADTIQESIAAHGWRGDHLVGYPLDGTIQLLTGSHRYEACRRLGRKIPVVVVPLRVVRRCWGDLSAWARLLALGSEIEQRV